jgi:ankyrin repeat protein
VPFFSSLQSPQAFLDSALKTRGYSTKCFTTTNSGYQNAPTPLQLASYDVHILKMVVLDKDAHALLDMLTCGISPNACNKFGESLLHRVCKFGQDKLLQVFLECGADIQISDGTGRTPMHEVCRRPRPSFRTFELLLQQDARLIHMQDSAGATPLSFIRADQYDAWIAFLASILDTYWKPRDASTGVQGPPPLALEKSNSRPVPDPENALSLELAALVSGGRMEPGEAIAAYNPAEDDEDDTSWDDYDDDSDDDFDETEFDEKEFAELQELVNFGSSYQHRKEISLGRYFL